MLMIMNIFRSAYLQKAGYLAPWCWWFPELWGWQSSQIHSCHFIFLSSYWYLWRWQSLNIPFTFSSHFSQSMNSSKYQYCGGRKTFEFLGAFGEPFMTKLLRYLSFQCFLTKTWICITMSCDFLPWGFQRNFISFSTSKVKKNHQLQSSKYRF